MLFGVVAATVVWGPSGSICEAGLPGGWRVGGGMGPTGPCPGRSIEVCWVSSVAAVPSFPLTWVVGGGDMGLFLMLFAAPGLEQGGGEARGGWKGDEAEGLG